jgi:hypothetical protein
LPGIGVKLLPQFGEIGALSDFVPKTLRAAEAVSGVTRKAPFCGLIRHKSQYTAAFLARLCSPLRGLEYARMTEPEPDAFDVGDIEQDEENDDAGKAADERRNRRISWVACCLFGTFAAAAGLLSGLWPKLQLTAFLILFAVLVPVLSVACHWVFITHPLQISEKLAAEDRSRRPVDDEEDYAFDEGEEQARSTKPEDQQP